MVAAEAQLIKQYLAGWIVRRLCTSGVTHGKDPPYRASVRDKNKGASV